MFTDQVSPLEHMNARDTSFVLVSQASQPEIERYKRRMGWTIPWYTVVGTDFQAACGVSTGFALDVFLRDGDRVFLTYATSGRGVEALGSIWTFLDLTPFGRQEEWEDTPARAPADAGLRLVAQARRIRGEAHDFRPRRGCPARGAGRAGAGRKLGLARAAGLSAGRRAAGRAPRRP